MKILHVVYNLIRGGTEGQCARVALELARRGVALRVAVTHREGYFLDPVERACGAVHELGITRMISPVTAARLLRFRRWIRRECFDVVHAWDADAAIFADLATRGTGIPLVTSRRDLGDIYAPRKRRRMQRADARARLVVVNAEAIRAKLVSEGLPPDRIRLIPNVLDIEEFDRLSARPLPEGVRLPDGPLVGMVARLDPEKDASTWIEAASVVARERPDVRFVTAGDGPQRDLLEARVRELGLVDRILFLGDITWTPALVRRLTAGVLCPKSNEGLSNTILEYMAAGLPVVATDCGGNRELVREGDNGHVIPIGDVRSLANRLLDVLADPTRTMAMGQRGRARVERDHLPARVGDQFLEVYREVRAHV